MKEALGEWFRNLKGFPADLPISALSFVPYLPDSLERFSRSPTRTPGTFRDSVADVLNAIVSFASVLAIVQSPESAFSRVVPNYQAALKSPGVCFMLVESDLYRDTDPDPVRAAGIQIVGSAYVKYYGSLEGTSDSEKMNIKTTMERWRSLLATYSPEEIFRVHYAIQGGDYKLNRVEAADSAART